MKKTFANIKKVYNYGKKYRKALYLEAMGSLIGIALEIAVPIIIARQTLLLTSNLWNQLIIMSLVLLLVDFASGLKTVLVRKNTQKFYVGVTEKMQNELSHEVLRIQQKDLDNTSSGVFVQRLTSDVDELSNLFTVGFGRVVGILSSLGAFISVFIINKIVFVFYFAVSIIFTILNLVKYKKYSEKDREKRKVNERVVGLTSELVRGTRDVKMLNAKESFIDKLNEVIKEKNRKHIQMRNIDIKYNLIYDLLLGFFEFILMVLFVYLITRNLLTLPMALALYSYRYKVMTNLMYDVSLLIEEVNQFNISFDRVFAIFDGITFRKEKFGKKHLSKIKGDFEFRNVDFSYENGLKVLDGISFKVKANTTVGFVGESGSGKTTIFNLLCKMYDVSKGEILIDGTNINELDEDSLRGNITIIGQSPYIFNMSIFDNMKLVKSSVTLDEVKKACRLACLDEFIESLPDKYDSVIGEGGVNLSGGQKQRLAIARALIQKTEIILFDEATSALDNVTQSRIQDAINNLKNEYTIMIIAHRFSTILNCDNIFFIDKGRIIASGTHDELLKSCKPYKKLYLSEIKKQK